MEVFDVSEVGPAVADCSLTGDADVDDAFPEGPGEEDEGFEWDMTIRGCGWFWYQSHASKSPWERGEGCLCSSRL